MIWRNERGATTANLVTDEHIEFDKWPVQIQIQEFREKQAPIHLQYFTEYSSIQ